MTVSSHLLIYDGIFLTSNTRVNIVTMDQDLTFNSHIKQI